jgi:3-oxoacid CoA-transferase B subunit
MPMVEKERLTRDVIAMRVAAEIPAGSYVNLGIGMPTLVADYVDPDKHIVFHSENGVLGLGPFPPRDGIIKDLINAGGQYTTMIQGASLMDSAQSFTIVRGGHLDVAVLGGLQVSERGDLANWRRGDRKVGSIGGAADIAAGAKRVFIAMEHNTKDGQAKIVRACTYPLTAVRAVSMIFTDVAVVRVDEDGLTLLEGAPDWTPEEIQSVTEAKLKVSPDFCDMQL